MPSVFLLSSSAGYIFSGNINTKNFLSVITLESNLSAGAGGSCFQSTAINNRRNKSLKSRILNIAACGLVPMNHNSK